MIEEIQSFVEFTDGVMGRLSLQRAFLEAGRAEEYLTKLEKEPLDNINFFLTADQLKNSSIGPRLEQLSHRMATELKDYRKVAELLYFRLIMNQPEKAVDLLKQYPELVNFVENFRVPFAVKTCLDLNVFKRFVELTENKNVRDKVFRLTMLQLTTDGKIDEAKECLKFAEEVRIDVSQCPPRALQLLDRETSRDSPVTETEEAEARSN